jgi:hypothetical protein
MPIAWTGDVVFFFYKSGYKNDFTPFGYNNFNAVVGTDEGERFLSENFGQEGLLAVSSG